MPRLADCQTRLASAARSLQGRNLVSVQELDSWEVLALLCAARELKSHVESQGGPLDAFTASLVRKEASRERLSSERLGVKRPQRPADFAALRVCRARWWRRSSLNPARELAAPSRAPLFAWEHTC